MTLTNQQEAARQDCRAVLHQFIRGRITYMEMLKYIYKQVARHRYSDAWMEIAAIALAAHGLNDFDEMVARYFSEDNCI